MTLPNRPGYVVSSERKEESLPPSSSSTIHTNAEENHTSGVQPTFSPDSVHLMGLFPFASQRDMVSMAAAGMFGYSSELAHNFEHNSNPLIGAPRLDMLKQEGMDPSSIEEITARKNYIRAHRLLHATIEFMAMSKREGITTSTEIFNQSNNLPHPGPIDFSLDDFLASQGIETDPESDELEKSTEREEFLFKLEQIRSKYMEELEKLNRICGDFSSRMFLLLREQSTMRPLSDQEIQLKLYGIQQKFDYVKNQLRQNVCNAIVSLEKQHVSSKKKRRALPKKAAESLSKWFFDHLNDPYPSEEEKSLLAAAGGLTITQVNNWFGNKRIRYKRKCIEEEARRAGIEGEDPVQKEVKRSRHSQ